MVTMIGMQKQRDLLAKMDLATGRSIPFDAGKYNLCMSMPRTRFFLAHFVGQLPASIKGSTTQIPLELGLCLPDSCVHSDVEYLFTSNSSMAVLFRNGINPLLQQFKFLQVNVSSPQLDLKPEDTTGVVAAVFVGSLFLWVVVSTFLVTCGKRSATNGAVRFEQAHSTDSSRQLLPEVAEGLQPSRTSSASNSVFIQALSLVGKHGTLVKLLECPEYKPTDSLNGLRVLSMIWIILGHTFLMPTAISGYTNMEDFHSTTLDKDTAEQNPFFFLIISAQSGVDTFFFLSGFLLSLLTVRELQSRNGKMSIPAAIFLRYVRLTPSLAMVMVVYYKIWSLLGSGPFAPRFQDSVNSRCDGSWWSELTYTMNFIPFDSDKVCLGWTWYLGDDMIFFIITIALLPMYYRRRVFGWLAVLALMGLSFGITWWLIISHGLSVYVFDDHYQNYSYWAYSKPYTRIPAYLIGVVAAWCILELEKQGVTRQTARFDRKARITVFFAVVLAFAVLAFLIFIPFTDFGDHMNSWDAHPIYSVLYLGFGRALWSLCWAVITLACYYNYVPIIDGVLAHRCWTPLARLTYGAYLIHPLCIKLAAGTSVQYYTFSGMDLFYRHLGNCTCAYGGAVVLWCMVERPMITFTSVFLRSKSRKGEDVKEANLTPATIQGGDAPLRQEQ